MERLMSKNRKVVELPPTAQEHMSETAKIQLAEHAPHVITTPQPPPKPEYKVAIDSPGDTLLQGHAGQTDYFAFDVDEILERRAQYDSRLRAWH